MGRIACLEGDDFAPSEVAELRPRLPRIEPVFEEGAARDVSKQDDLTAEAERRRRGNVLRARMCVLRGAENRLRLLLTIDLVDFAEFQNRDTHAGLGCQGDILTWGQGFRGRLVHAERNRNRPGHAAGETQVVAAANVISLAHESSERRKGARREHLEVGSFAGSQRHHRQLFSVSAQASLFGGRGPQIDEFTTAVSGNRIIGNGAHRGPPAG